MKSSSPLGLTLFLAGVGAAGLGGYLLYKNKGLQGLRGVLGRGTLRTELAPPTPVVDRTEAGGMKLEHRRSSSMPIEQRVRNIQDQVWKGVRDPRMRKLALEITYHCPERDSECEAKAIYDAMKKRIRYTGDVAPVKMGADGPVEGVDLYQSPWRTWEFKGGDCDDHSGLAATLLSLNGIPARVRVTAENRYADWGHIYGLAGLPKNGPRSWKALDTTLPGNNRFGYEVPFGRNVDFDDPRFRGRDMSKLKAFDYPA